MREGQGTADKGAGSPIYSQDPHIWTGRDCNGLAGRWNDGEPYKAM